MLKLQHLPIRERYRLLSLLFKRPLPWSSAYCSGWQHSTLVQNMPLPYPLGIGRRASELLEHMVVLAKGGVNLRRKGVHYEKGAGAKPKRKQDAEHEEKASKARGEESSASGRSDGFPQFDPNNPSEEEKKIKEFMRKYRWLLIPSLIVGGYLLNRQLTASDNPYEGSAAREITWNDFVTNLLPRGTIRKIVISQELSKAYLIPSSHGQQAPYVMGIKNPQTFENDVRAAEVAMGTPPERWIQIEYQQLGGVRFLVGLGLLALILLPFIIAAKRMRSFKMSDMVSSMMKSRINIIDPHAKGAKLKIKFKDVAGLHEAKQEISEFVDYLKNPKKYTALGARLPKGALLTGPPGCGKTLLAKALAAEASSPFISMNGTEFVEMIGGLGASRIRDLFKTAKSRAPCIIYIDEIDAIGRRRSDDMSSTGSSGEEEQTLNQLLVEMDGMDSTQGVVVIASTNRPDILDKALMRPGRFDRHISCDLPTILERKELFDLYLRKVKIENSVLPFSQRLAQMTPGFSGADINNVVNEAAIHTATEKRKLVTLKDLDYALQKIIAGPEKRSKVLVQEEREIVAYHESGHALIGWLLEHTDALLKVTIIPRTSAALGFAQYSPKDRKLFSQEELFDRMCMMLGGRAAENVVFNRITTGAQNDLEKVTKQAFAQVRIYGMSRTVGPISFAPQPGDERAAEFQKKPYSQKLHKIIDQEAQGLVSRAYFFTEQLLKENRSKLEKLAKALLEREVLNYEDVKELIGPPKYGDKHVVELVEQILPAEPDKE